jgi:methanol--5-hydroxybenzimidazolylcobamide Co-methyltransferase
MTSDSVWPADTMAPAKRFRAGELAVPSLDDFVFGKAVHPVTCGRGPVCGGGTVVPEINFTLPPVEVN